MSKDPVWIITLILLGRTVRIASNRPVSSSTDVSSIVRFSVFASFTCFIQKYLKKKMSLPGSHVSCNKKIKISNYFLPKLSAVIFAGKKQSDQMDLNFKNDFDIKKYNIQKLNHILKFYLYI